MTKPITGIIKPFTVFALLIITGCSINQGDINLAGSNKDDRKVPAPEVSPVAPAVVIHEAVFIYSYTKDGKAVDSGRIIAVNPDGTVTLETKQTGETLRFKLDPRGWLLVKPPSPLEETPAKQ